MGQMCTNFMYRSTTLYIFFFLSLCSTAFSASVDQGKIKVTVNATNATRKEVMKSIEKQSNMIFFFKEGIVAVEQRVSIAMKDKTLDEVLGKFFEGTGLTWTYEDYVISVRQKVKGSLSSISTLPGVTAAVDSSITSMTVRGKVTSPDGSPIPGATVQVKRTKEGATTDAEGNFTLPNTRKNDVLLISSIGFEPREVSILGSSLLTQLNVAINGLDEAVIIGYGTTTKRFNTGSVSTVRSKDIEKQPLSNPLQALNGRVSGMLIQQQSGISGSTYKVQIRGQNSISNGSEPLYVIDGVPYMPSDVVSLSSTIGSGNPLSYINPSDIESVDVLKDADATAIYGSRGANGVVLITTKKGRIGKSNVNINFYHGVVQQRKLDLLGTEDYLKMRNEAYRNDNLIPSSQLGNTGYAPDLKIWDTTRSTDWQNYFLRNHAQYSDAQVSISGGSEMTKYLIGGGYHRETAVFPGNFADQKISLHYSITNASFNNKLQIQLSGNFLNDDNFLPQLDPLIYAYISPNAPKVFLPDNSLNWENGTFPNPYSNLLNNYKASVSNLVQNMSINYELLSGLGVKINLGYNIENTTEKTQKPIAALSPNSFTKLGEAQFKKRSINSWIAEPQLSYKRRVFKGNLELLVGSTFQQSKADGILTRGINYNNDALLGTIDGAGSTTSLASGNYLYKYNALFGRINYINNDKYLLNLTGRRDGSSRFGPGKQFANFGAVGIGWIFSNERWVRKLSNILSYGKVRSSYGITGNDQIGDYRFYDLYYASGRSYLGSSTLGPAALFNPNLAWEKNRKFEIATELGFLNDRIFGSVSYFKNRSSNQLVNTGLPSTTGFISILGNLPAVIENRGIEFEVTTTNVDLPEHKFKWTTAINFTTFKNRLKEFPDLDKNPTYKNAYVINEPLNIKKVYRYHGVDPEKGIYTFEDKDGKITSTPSIFNDRTTYISLDPKFYGGIENDLKLGDFQLSFLITFSKQTVRNSLFQYDVPGIFNLNISKEVYENHWKEPGDIARYQKFTQGIFTEGARAYNNVKNSEFAYVDGSFIRLQNVSFSYLLPTSICRRLRFSSFRIYTQCQNVFTLTKFNGRDPNRIADNNIAPQGVFVLGLNANL